jgi:phosphonate transport system substrate-binding protein
MILKRIAALLLTAGFVVAAACGSSDDDKGTTATSPQAPGQAAAAQATTDPRANWPKKFRVGYFGGDDAEQVLQNNEPMKQYLEKRLGMPVELFTGTSYGAVIEAMRADRVDAMLVGPFSYVLAVQEAKAEALAVHISTSAKEPKYDATILPFYISVVFAKKGNGINSINDLKGKGFNFVDPASTSGHLAPKTLLIKKGLNPDTDMKTVFAGTHPTAALSVWNDKAPAGGTNESNLNNLNNSGQVQWCKYPDGQINKVRSDAEIKALFDSCPNGQLVVLAQTDPIPNTPFAVRQNLPETFKAEVKKALLEIKDQPDMVTATKGWYVDPSAELKLSSLDQFYNSLRDIAKLLNLNLKELN